MKHYERILIAIMVSVLALFLIGMLYIDKSGSFNQDFKSDSIFQHYQKITPYH